MAVRLKYSNRYFTEDSDYVQVVDKLYEIADNLGFPFEETNNTSGRFSISDNVIVVVKYRDDRVMSIHTKITKNPALYDCTHTTSTIDNISTELQSCILIIKDIRSKLM